MEFEHIIESDDFTQTLQRTKAALEQLGYRLQSDAGRTWVYVRGNFLGALFALTPKSWQSTVVLEQAPPGLQIHLTVDMFGKIELPAGVQYWQKEVDFICRSATGESMAVEKVKFERPPVLKPMLSIMFVQFVFLSLGAILAMMAQHTIVFYIVAGIGTSLTGYIISKSWLK
jgi:hypothetical protein